MLVANVLVFVVLNVVYDNIGNSNGSNNVDRRSTVTVEMTDFEFSFRNH